MSIESGLRVAIRRTGAIASGLFVLGAAGAVLVAGTMWPPQPPGEPAADAVQVSPAPTALVCPGPPRVVTGEAGDDIEYDEEFGTGSDDARSVTDIAVISATQDPPSVTYTPLGDEAEELNGAEITLGDFTGASAPAVVRSGAEPAVTIGASTVARTDEGDLRGLSAAECTAPSTTQWFVGGSTQLGSSAQLTMVNPGETPVTASLDVWGDVGPIEAPSEILVPPGEAVAVLLETLELSDAIALRVNADGGYLASSIQSSSLDGIVAAGTDIITVASDPSTEIYAGPFIADTDADLAPVLRLVNPEVQEQATIDVRVLTDEGPVGLAGAQGQVLEPGVVTDISLDGIPSGPVTIEVTSDRPVTASVMRSAQGTAGELDPNTAPVDQAWLSGRQSQDGGVLNVPTGLVGATTVALSNPTDTDTEVTVHPVLSDGTVGDELAVTISAHSSTVLDADATADSDGSEVVAVQIQGEDVLASAMLSSEAPDGELIAMIGLTPDTDDGGVAQVRLSSN